MFFAAVERGSSINMTSSHTAAVLTMPIVWQRALLRHTDYSLAVHRKTTGCFCKRRAGLYLRISSYITLQKR